MKKYLNQVIQGDCLEVMKQLPDKCIDLVLTSPPYDKARDYKGGLYFDFEGIAQESARVIKDTGVIAWNVADTTNDFCESLTSFKQAIFFVEKCGLKLVDTMIYQKLSYPPPYPSNKRYAHVFEYVFIFAKTKSFTFNPMRDRENKGFGKTYKSSTRMKDGSLRKLPDKVAEKYGLRTNIWAYNVGWGHSYIDKAVSKHPAVMPIKLAEDLIKSFSKEGDTILDPFAGSCTTAIACKELNRNYICIEKEKEYCDICQVRIDSLQPTLI